MFSQTWKEFLFVAAPSDSYLQYVLLSEKGSPSKKQRYEEKKQSDLCWDKMSVNICTVAFFK